MNEPQETQYFIWENEDIRARYDALLPSEADMGELEYWQTLRDVGERVSIELRDDYESTLSSMQKTNSVLFQRAATRLAQIKELQAMVQERDELIERLLAGRQENEAA